METCLSELDKRIPTNWRIFENMISLNPQKILSTDRVPFSSLPFLSFCQGNLHEIEEQYRNLPHVNWSKYEVFEAEGKIPDDPVCFFATVRNYKTGDEYPFRKLADFVLGVYSIPVSNAYIERIFSMISYIKNKWRNRLSLNMTNSIVRVKSHLHSRNLCCVDMKITPDMLNKHNVKMYSFKSKPTDVDKGDAEEDLDNLLNNLHVLHV